MSRGVTALITGASSGIGKALAQVFAEHGFHLVLVARNIDALNQLAAELKDKFHISVRTLQKDLTNPHAPDQIYQEMQRSGAMVDMLINNAGVGMSGAFLKNDLTAELSMMQLNINSLTHMTKLFVKDMVERKSGKIMNVSSTAAFQPGPLMAVYYATKAYVLSFSEALSEELRNTGVTVTALCPGPTASNFQSRAGIERVRLLTFGKMSSEEVARAGFSGLMKNRRVVIPGFSNWFFASIVRFLPGTWVLRMVKWLQTMKYEND